MNIVIDNYRIRKFNEMNLCIETVSEIVNEGHRILIFSQFVKMLNP